MAAGLEVYSCSATIYKNVIRFFALGLGRLGAWAPGLASSHYVLYEWHWRHTESARASLHPVLPCSASKKSDPGCLSSLCNHSPRGLGAWASGHDSSH
mmetsp:Transcript_23563/g.59493  ORF Transcript_23563/g.59493 Transcript_23563/m.59493 type:complete len:98 (-) Transcript_23563:80-373(-)